MKNLLFLGLALLMLSCNNVEKYRADIEDLSSQFSSIENTVAELSNAVKTQQQNYLNAVDSLTIDEKVFMKLKEVDQKSFTETKDAAKSISGGYKTILDLMTEFSNQWSEKKADLETLTNGLESKKLPKDVASQIANLKNYLEGTSAPIDSWKNALSTLDSMGNQKITEVKNLIESLTAGKK